MPESTQPFLNDRQLVSISIAARRMGFHVITVRKWVYSGEIQSQLVGKVEKRIPQSEIVRIMEHRRGAKKILYARGADPLTAESQMVALRQWFLENRKDQSCEEILEIGPAFAAFGQKKFLRLLNFIETRKVSEIFLFSKDAIVDHADPEVCRFVFDYFCRHVESFGGFVRVISEL